jgi:hypothetical protein
VVLSDITDLEILKCSKASVQATVYIGTSPPVVIEPSLKTTLKVQQLSSVSNRVTQYASPAIKDVLCPEVSTDVLTVAKRKRLILALTVKFAHEDLARKLYSPPQLSLPPFATVTL